MRIHGIRLPKLGTHPLLFHAELQPQHNQHKDKADDPAHLGECDGGAKKPGQNAGVDGVAYEGVGAGGNQLVALLNGDRAAPVAAEVMARPDGEENADDGNCSSNQNGQMPERQSGW